MADMVVKIRNTNLPHLIFEWHPLTKKVYLIHVGSMDEQKRLAELGVIVRLDAEVIAEHCDTHALAYGFVQTWSRGYFHRSREMTSGKTD